VTEGILRGIYCLRPTDGARVHLLGSGAILNEAVKAQQILTEKFGIAADVWSVTSYQQLHREALSCARFNSLHPGEAPRVPYVTSVFGDWRAPIVAASDYVKALPESVAQWLPGPMISLGTDGFGRSDGRAELRAFFEVDARHIAYAALWQLQRSGDVTLEALMRAQDELGIDTKKGDPARS